MTERVLRDYFATFRWKKIKESHKVGSWWPGIYFLSMCPALLHAFDDYESILLYYLITIPLVFAMFVPTMHNMKLPKLMYLCPLNTAQRREYIVKSGAIRVMMSVLIDIIGVSILFACGICDWLMAISIFLNLALLSVAIGSGININGYGKITDQGYRVVDPKNKKELLEMWVCLIALLTFLAQYGIVLYEEESLLLRIIAIGLPLVVLLPPTIAYLRFWKQAVTENMTYER